MNIHNNGDSFLQLLSIICQINSGDIGVFETECPLRTYSMRKNKGTYLQEPECLKILNHQLHSYQDNAPSVNFTRIVAVLQHKQMKNFEQSITSSEGNN